MCADRHGEPIATRGRLEAGALALLILSLLFAGLVPARESRAEDAAGALRIVWSAAERLYVASPDSGAIVTGMVVRVLDRGREIATGQVTSVLDGVMASVRITEGAIAPEARLDRLEVRVYPAAPAVPPALRIGLPAPSRNGLAFWCADARLDPLSLPRAYRAESLGADRWRLLASDSIATGSAWPETLLVRMFGDRADEEIALERGDLDLAVFWPGEPSARLRHAASGYETLLGNRTRGALVALGPANDSRLAARLGLDMAALNTEMFGGDLLRWPGPEAGTAASPLAARGIRYIVDTSLPGQRPIERFLERRPNAPARPDDPAIRLAYLDAPITELDSLVAARNGRDARPLFTMRCPELCKADLAPALRALGVDAFANLLQCGAGTGRP